MAINGDPMEGEQMLRRLFGLDNGPSSSDLPSTKE